MKLNKKIFFVLVLVPILLLFSVPASRGNNTNSNSTQPNGECYANDLVARSWCDYNNNRYTTDVYGITNSTSNVDVPLYRQIQELRLNPYFAPDESCMFDAYQLHCIPGEDQDCPKGYGGNEDGTCFVDHSGTGCPDGYHSATDDETGQCYPDTDPCYPGQIRDPNEDIATCDDISGLCPEANLTSCFVDGIPIDKYPTSGCLNNPNMENCAIIGYQCPDTFATMSTYNETGNHTSKCVPKSLKVTANDEREREARDPLRCAAGYELQINENENIYRRGGENPIGTCNRLGN